MQAWTCFYTIVVILLSFCLSGCPKKESPSPSDTVLGKNMSSNREDWINETDASISEGLMPRDASFMEGKTPQHVQASVFFDFDHFNLKPNERDHLAQVSQYLKQNPTITVLLEGHCDWHGTVEYNLALGDKRASVVRDYLENLGIQHQRMETLSKGSLEATPHLDKQQAAKDRRVDVLVMQ